MELSRFFRQSDAQIGIIFALVCLPLLVITGFAVDFARQHSTDRHLEFAADMASLAGARAMDDASLSDAQIRTVAMDSYFAQLKSAHADVACDAPIVSVDRAGRQVTVAGDCDLPTIFGANISGRDKVGVGRSAVGKVDLTSLELALVLDVSDSMHGDPLAALKDAANHLAGKVLNSRTHDRVRVALVPFSTSVNAGLYGNRAMGRADNDDRFGDGTHVVCVAPRRGVEKLSDAKPAPGSWVEENDETYREDRCPSVSVMPLENDVDAAATIINSLATSDRGTAGNTALAWAWYVLSPNWISIWPTESAPVAYGTENVRKAVVLLSDGAFNESYNMTNGFYFIHTRNEAIDLCDGMRDAGIELYVIGFKPVAGASWWSPRNVLRRCAGRDGFYFEADHQDDFHDIFDRVSTKLVGTRLIN